jgi:hypothetical protein
MRNRKERAVFILDTAKFKLRKRQDNHNTLIKISFQQDNIIITNIPASNMEPLKYY